MQNLVTNVVITSAARTAVGSYGKSLKDVKPTELGAIASRAAIERSGISGDDVDHVVFGNVIHTQPADMYMARVVGIKAGIPKETPAYTVNRLCGTGVQAIVSATQAIQADEAKVALAGGAGVDEPRAVLDAERALGRPHGRHRAGRPRDGRPDRPVPRHPDGRHGREPRRARTRSPARTRTPSPSSPTAAPGRRATPAASTTRSCRCP